MGGHWRNHHGLPGIGGRTGEQAPGSVLFGAAVLHREEGALPADPVGWESIIYLASLSRINPELYEAARVDGAGRLRCMWHITLPGITDVIVIMLILRIGNLLNVGFEQNMVLVNPFVRDVGEILDTYVWRTGLREGRFSYAAAAGLFKTIIAAVLLNTADKVSKKFNQQGLF